MTSHDDETIERVAHGVLDTTWPYAEWSHAAHFAAALWLLRSGCCAILPCWPSMAGSKA